MPVPPKFCQSLDISTFVPPPPKVPVSAPLPIELSYRVSLAICTNCDMAQVKGRIQLKIEKSAMANNTYTPPPPTHTHSDTHTDRDRKTETQTDRDTPIHDSVCKSALYWQLLAICWCLAGGEIRWDYPPRDYNVESTGRLQLSVKARFAAVPTT